MIGIVRVPRPCPIVRSDGRFRRSTMMVGTCLRFRGFNRPVCQRVFISDDRKRRTSFQCSNFARKNANSRPSSMSHSRRSLSQVALSSPRLMARRTVTHAQLSRRANWFAVTATVGHLGRIYNNLNNAIQRLQPRHFLCARELLAFVCVFAPQCPNYVALLRLAL
jgi:hypothetical protein